MGWGKRWHRLRYFCADAWDEWRHSLAVNLLALVTLVSALFVAGLVMLIASNIEYRVQALRDDVRVEVYLRDDQGDDDRRMLLQRLRASENVERVNYVDKAEALRRYREWAADLAELANELDANPLPASLEVFLTPGAEAATAATAIAVSLKGQAGVEEVRFNREWLGRLESLAWISRVGGGGVVALVFVAVVFVMSSVLRLAVYARREEIEIMHLVGATPGFIRGPFLVAGAVQGSIASLLALLSVEGLRASVISYGNQGSVALLDLIAAEPLAPSLAGSLFLLGFLVSLVGSYSSVRQSV